jgi:ferredoxin
MRVRVNPSRCQGHAMCALACPEVFHLSDEDGHATASPQIVPRDLEDSVLQAQRSCPEQAIEIDTAAQPEPGPQTQEDSAP